MLYLLFAFVHPSTGIAPVRERVTHNKPVITMPAPLIIIPSKQWSTLLEEHFESGMPAEWTVLNWNGDGFTWTTGTTYDLDPEPPDYGTAYAYYSDDDAGSSAPQSQPGEDILTPPVYIAPYDTVRIIFAYGNSWTYDYDDIFGVWIRTFSGGAWSSWTNIANYPNETSGYDTIDIISSKVIYDSVQVMWRYSDNGGWNYACGIDNVYILGHFPPPEDHDVGTLSFTSPPQFYNTNTYYNVTATFKNFGLNPETFSTMFYLFDEDMNVFSWKESTNISLNPDDTIRIEFASAPTGNRKKILKRALTTLTGDERTLNDTLEQWIYADIDGRSFYNESDPHPPIYPDKDVPYTVWTYISNDGAVDDTFDITIEITLNGNPIFTGSLLDHYIPGNTEYSHFWGQVSFNEYGDYQLKQIISSPYDIRNGNDTLIVNGRVVAWKPVTNMPQILMDHCVVFDGSKVYVFGGYNGASSISDLYIYSFAKGSWTTGASLPIDLCMADACILGDTIYFPGGNSYSSGSIIDNLYKYSISGDNWTVSPGTGEPCWFYACEAANGKVYKIGGYNDGTGQMYASTWEYDPTTGNWTKKSDMPFACELMFSFSRNDTIYLVGGFDGTNIRNETRFYDAVNDVWTMDNSIFAYYPIGIWGGSSVLYKDTLFCLGGVNTSWVLCDSVYYYNDVSNEWILHSRLTRPVYRADGCGIEGLGKSDYDGKYIFGGSVGGFSPIDTVFANIAPTVGIPDKPKEVSISFTKKIGPEIRFVVNGKGSYNISIFDVTGRIVKRLKTQGGVPVSVSTREYKKGIYFIKVNGIDKAEKIILIK